jgi:hypothetical protein
VVLTGSFTRDLALLGGISTLVVNRICAVE